MWRSALLLAALSSCSPTAAFVPRGLTGGPLVSSSAQLFARRCELAHSPVDRCVGRMCCRTIMMAHQPGGPEEEGKNEEDRVQPQKGEMNESEPEEEQPEDFRKEDRYAVATVLGATAIPIALGTQYRFITAGHWFMSGPQGGVEALSYVVMGGIAVWAIVEQFKNGRGLPTGAFGILGISELCSYVLLGNAVVQLMASKGISLSTLLMR